MGRSPKALIIGIGGQDGYFASWLFVNKGYQVTGVLLESDLTNETIAHLPATKLNLMTSSIDDLESLRHIIRSEQPEIILNFAGISFIPYSWEKPSEIEKINGYAVGEILQIILEESPKTKFFQASSSEMFGHHPSESPQNEQTPLNPENPYGSSKVFAYHLTKNYRERYGMFACSGILYNHESEWRPQRFVTRKITLAGAKIKLGLQETLHLGELNTVRDWSYAGDIVEGIWLMMNSDEPNDYVLSSGKLYSVKDVLDVTFAHLGLAQEDRVIIDTSLIRKSEGLPLCGDSTKARRELCWRPQITFDSMIKKMVDRDLERMRSL